MSRAPVPLFDPLQILRVRWHRIAWFAAAGIGLGLIYFLLAPRWYTSTLSVVPVATRPSGSLALQAASAVGLDVGELGGSGGGADVDRINAVLESNSVVDALIDKFDLRARYGQRYIENVRKELWRHCSIKTDKRARVVSLQCEDKDPRFCRDMTQHFAEVANQVFRRVNASSASEEARFLEKRVAEARRQADEAAQRVRDFQEQHKLIDIEEQSKAVVSAMASLKSEAISKELQLSYMSRFSSREESTARQLREQIVILDAKQRALEGSPNQSAPIPLSKSGEVDPKLRGESSARVFPQAMVVPQLRYELQGLLRDEKLSQTVYLLLMQRLASAQVNEARDTSAFQVLDVPIIADHKSRPMGPVVLAVGLMAGLLLGALWSLTEPFMEWQRRLGLGRPV